MANVRGWPANRRDCRISPLIDEPTKKISGQVPSSLCSLNLTRVAKAQHYLRIESISSDRFQRDGLHHMFKHLITGTFLIALGACAINPLPEDVTGVDTYDIVRQIRCESRESVRLRLLAWLDSLAETENPVAAKLVSQYRQFPESIATFDYKIFGATYPNIRSVAHLFYSTGIAYSFDLTMTEDNDLTTDFNLLGPLSAGKITLGLNAGLKRKRANERVFVVTDTFASLLQMNREIRGVRYCDRKIVQENYIYPIAGRIGVDQLVRDFMNVTVFGSLSDAKSAPNAKITAPTMADKLTFTTVVNLTATPKIEFTPGASDVQLTSGTLTAGAVRTDAHQVTVALAVDSEEISELRSLRSYLFSDRRDNATPRSNSFRNSGASVIVGTRVTGEVRTRSEALAVLAIDQLKSREVQLVLSP